MLVVLLDEVEHWVQSQDVVELLDVLEPSSEVVLVVEVELDWQGGGSFRSWLQVVTVQSPSSSPQNVGHKHSQGCVVPDAPDVLDVLDVLLVGHRHASVVVLACAVLELDVGLQLAGSGGIQ